MASNSIQTSGLMPGLSDFDPEVEQTAWKVQLKHLFHGEAAAGSNVATVPDMRWTGREFALLLFVVTLIPVPIFAVLSGLPTHKWAVSGLDALFFISLAHVGLSGFFWIDHRYRKLMTARPRQYYLNAVLIAIVAVGGAAIYGSPFVVALYVIQYFWNTWHFAMQNWGVMCMTALGTESPKPGRAEKCICYLGVLGGGLGFVSTLDGWRFLEHASLPGYWITLGAVALSLFVAARQVSTRVHPIRIAVTLATGAFFLPIFLFPPGVGTVAVGAMHAAQYIVIMVTLASDRKQGVTRLRIGCLVLLVPVYLSIYLALTNDALWGDWIQSARSLMSAILIWHYIVDAGLFRLSQPGQRAAIRQSFPFLFSARSGAATGRV
jgi:hypothetical protein